MKDCHYLLKLPNYHLLYNVDMGYVHFFHIVFTYVCSF